jgi:hypothetical protein
MISFRRIPLTNLLEYILWRIHMPQPILLGIVQVHKTWRIMLAGPARSVVGNAVGLTIEVICDSGVDDTVFYL